MKTPELAIADRLRETFDWGGVEVDERTLVLAAETIIETLNAAGYAIVPAALTDSPSK